MERKAVVTLALANSLLAFSIGIVGPLYSIFLERISDNLFDVGFAYGLFWVLVAFLELSLGRHVDKIGYEKALMIGLSLSAISETIYIFAHNIHYVYLAQVTSALGYAIQYPAFYSLLSTIAKEEKGKFISLVDSFYNLAYGIAAILSGAFVSLAGFQTVFTLSASFHLISGFVIKNVSKA